MSKKWTLRVIGFVVGVALEQHFQIIAALMRYAGS